MASTARKLQRSLLAGNAVSGILYAAQVSACLKTIDHLKLGSTSTLFRTEEKAYVAFSVTLAILRAFELVNSLYSYYILSNLDPKACKKPSPQNKRVVGRVVWWVNTVGVCAGSLASVMGQALLLYRCYAMMIFNVLTALPSLASLLFQVAFSVHAVAFLIHRLLPNRFSGIISDKINPGIVGAAFYFIVATVSILHIPHAQGDIDMISISLETGLPLAILGGIVCVLQRKDQVTLLGFALTQTALAGLVAQVSILRIVTGIAWSY